MLNLKRWKYLAVWAAVAVTVWAVLVPDTLSRAAFMWLNLALIFGLVFATAIWSGTRPTRSVAQLLHDVESDAKLG